MKICHISSAHPADDVRIFHKQCKTLNKNGYEVTLISPHERNETISGIKIEALPKTKNRVVRMSYLLIKVFILALKQKADLYHIRDPELIPVGLLLKFFTREKIIYDAHEDYRKQILSKNYIPKAVRVHVASLMKMIEFLSSKVFDGIISATDDILRNFSFHNYAISIKNFPILSEYPDSHWKKKNQTSRKIHLIYIGGLSEMRGVTHIIRALEFFPSNDKLTLLLAGRFSPDTYASEITRLKGFKKVKFCGWINPEKIPALLKSADIGMVCLYPRANYVTSLPVKMFEYMSAGIPVVASNFPLWKDIVEGAGCGLLVDPLDPKSIADAIQWMLDHPQEAQKMGEKGRTAVQKYYNWDREGNKLIEFYKQILAD